MVIWVAGRLAYGYITQDTNGGGGRWRRRVRGGMVNTERENRYWRMELA